VSKKEEEDVDEEEVVVKEGYFSNKISAKG